MRLTARQLDRLLMQPSRFSENTRAMARAILVDGKSPTVVGALHKVSRQAAHRAARKVYRAYLDAVDCPDGWKVVEVRLPAKLARQIQELEREQLALFQRHVSSG